MKKTIGVLAHVDAGKTTFSETILYHTNTIKKCGRVDHKDTFLDNKTIEKERGITVFADQAHFEYNDSQYYLMDTPGHVDFSPEMERAIQIMDYAVVIISAVEGVEGHTSTVWELLQQYQIPTFFFINKTDREGADVDKVIDEMRENFSNDFFLLRQSSKLEDMDEELIEFTAERNEELLNTYLESGYNKEMWLHHLTEMVRENNIYFCSSGSALKDTGVLQFLENLDVLTKTRYDEKGDFSGRVYKIRYDEKGNRLTYIKALRGTLYVRDAIKYGTDKRQKREKVTQLRIYNGLTYQTVDQVTAGDLFVVIGFSEASVGDSVGSLLDGNPFRMIPTLKSRVVYDPSNPIKEVWEYFSILGEEDPSLQVMWDEYLQEIHIHVMGMIQLEVLEQIVKERFQLVVSFQDPEILYQETITTQVNGYGHFEPLKHYAEVHLRLEPMKRGQGITFENRCHANDLSVGHQRLVRQHIFERNHHGILTGSTLTDVKIILLTGRAHPKHTSGGDFREATFRALRQGLEKAENILLEPYYLFKIKVDLDHLGRVLTDIQKASGEFTAPETVRNQAIVKGKVPVSTFMNYSQTFASFTHGKGVIHLRYGGYDLCHNREEVIERINYNKDADYIYSSHSIFCAKGKGYKVAWDEVENMLHVK